MKYAGVPGDAAEVEAAAIYCEPEGGQLPPQLREQGTALVWLYCSFVHMLLLASVMGMPTIPNGF